MQLLAWSDKYSRMGVRANADQPDQAELAYAFGARGIGLCRTEHMFFGEGRLPIVRRMILADNEADRRAALAELLPLQREDFYGVFKAMHGEPVTIRTIDPPLHEFLPKREELMVDVAKLEARADMGPELEEKRLLLRRVEQLHEFNPMLGHRGVRLGITYPEITEMQTRAIIEAACQLAKEGVKVTKSGLQYKVVKAGTGPKPAATDTVTVHYQGTLIDGTEFDSSYKRGEPTSFPLNRVIKGWTEGLQLMKEGATYMFYIPGDLAYGPNPRPGGKIGPNATLIFKVELIKVAK